MSDNNKNEQAQSAPVPNSSENPYESSRASYYALFVLTLVYCFSFVDRQLTRID